MNIQWRTVKGFKEPAPLDITSSAKYVYLRKEIEQITEEDPMTGEEIECWQYDEAKITKEEYEANVTGLTFQALIDQQVAMDDANALLMLSQANIEATQADQDETLALILINTQPVEEV